MAITPSELKKILQAKPKQARKKRKAKGEARTDGETWNKLGGTMVHFKLTGKPELVRIYTHDDVEHYINPDRKTLIEKYKNEKNLDS
jgi:hypothetical protein